MFEAAKERFVAELKVAGMIHPHSGQEQLVRGALEVFAAEIAPQPVIDEAPAEAKGAGPEPIEPKPSADDLDAVAAEQAAKAATSGAADQADGVGAEQGPNDADPQPAAGLSPASTKGEASHG